jgi:hypothetical protein
MVNPFHISSCIVRIRRKSGIFSSTYLGCLGLCHWGLWIFYLAGAVGAEILGLERFGDMAPLCIFWCLWWERNTRCFEGMERNVLELKGLVLRTLMEWSKASGVLVFSSVLDFLESCNA